MVCKTYREVKIQHRKKYYRDSQDEDNKIFYPIMVNLPFNLLDITVDIGLLLT